jgi:hypothetical protein
MGRTTFSPGIALFIPVLCLALAGCGEEKTPTEAGGPLLRVRVEVAGAVPETADSLVLQVLDPATRDLLSRRSLPVTQGKVPEVVDVGVPSAGDVVVWGTLVAHPGDGVCGQDERGGALAGVSPTVRLAQSKTTETTVRLAPFVPETRIAAVQGFLVTVAWASVPGADSYVVRMYDHECQPADVVVEDTLATVDLSSRLLDQGSQGDGLLRVRARNEIVEGQFSPALNLRDLPLCRVEPAFLDLGEIPVGDSLETHFVIRNEGGGELSGQVASTCPEVVVTAGGGEFSLAGGESLIVRLSVAPGDEGPLECLVETGTGCAQVPVTALGVPGPVCQVDPPEVDFGVVPVGQTATQEVVITNAGGGILLGTVTEECPEPVIDGDGEGVFRLGPGERYSFLVTFEPAEAGSLECQVSLGTLCDVLPVRGFAEEPPRCVVEPETLDFGPVGVGDAVAASLIIRNAGGGTLSGEVSLACEAFTILSGGGQFSLASGASREVRIQFAPQEGGSHACSLATGSVCGEVPLRGEGVTEPACRITPPELDFGELEEGTSAERELTIRNTGTGILSGTLEADCPELTIVGSASFSLGAQESTTVTVRLEAGAPGSVECLLQAGSLCDPVPVRAEVVARPRCLVEPSSLEFGEVTVGEEAQRSFVVTNAGGGILAVEPDLDCQGFRIASGGGSHELAAGESLEVVVAFAPDEEGETACDLDLGTACEPLALHGTGVREPACRVSPDTLEFGTVVVGESRELAFTLRNVGGGVLSGEILADCQDLEVVSGGGSYALTAGESLQAVVRFAPSTPGQTECWIALGDACGELLARGQGGEPAACRVDPELLDFGLVALGETRQESLRVTNVGGDTLRGAVSLEGQDMELVEGEGPFALGPAETLLVVVAFHPETEGTVQGWLDLGAACDPVGISATSWWPPECQLDPPSLDFGGVTVGESRDLWLNVTNVGGGTLTGEVLLPPGAFRILSGGGSYALGPGATRRIHLSYEPDATGRDSTALEVSPACDPVPLTGTGLSGTGCLILPSEVNFLAVPVDTFKDATFEIINVGDIPIDGDMADGCYPFTVMEGAGPYHLEPGETLQVVLRYEPPNPGTHACLIPTGLSCPFVLAFGSGIGAASCAVDPQELDFGDVIVGTWEERSFVIRNEGEYTFSGNVYSDCDEFMIVQGAGSYELDPGEERTVVVRFSPTEEGPQSCVVVTSSVCPPVLVSGQGVLGPICSVNPPVLDFGEMRMEAMTVDMHVDRTVTIKNEGTADLEGEVTLDPCLAFSLVSGGGPFVLAPGQAHQVTVRFRPRIPGTYECTLRLGGTCDDVPCVGRATAIMEGSVQGP